MGLSPSSRVKNTSNEVDLFVQQIFTELKTMLDVILGSKDRAVNNINSLFSWSLHSNCGKKEPNN